MTPVPMTVTEAIFTAFLKCPYKAYLKLRREAGQVSDYERVQFQLEDEYRRTGQEVMQRTHRTTAAVRDPPSLAVAIQTGAMLILDAAVGKGDMSCRLDAVMRSEAKGATSGGICIPVLFIPHEPITADDRLRLAFGAAALASTLGTRPERGRIVHGPNYKVTRGELAAFAEPVESAVGQIRALGESVVPPPQLLNRHCAECEFRQSCRAAAIKRDDLSLLRGLSPKEIAGLNRRGIFTVTQYSYTFRPGCLKRADGPKSGRHDHPLQALAIRDQTIYVAHRPQLPDGRIRIYLDVEGLPDRDFYYLIGLAWDDGTGMRRSSFWADREADEEVSWGEFLEIVRGFGEDFVLFHYGSYETQFLGKMANRHGGDQRLIAQIKARCVNVLSAINARIYFPVYANDLKSIAGCLGFRWSDPGASGIQSIAWRSEWEVTAEPTAKQKLLTYNLEDCSALARVVAVLRDLTSGTSPGDAGSPGVAGVEDIVVPRGHKYCDPNFVLPDFGQISKCAYFDYQRDRILFRTSPAVRKANRRKKSRPQPICKINQVIEHGTTDHCPHCGSDNFGTRDHNSRVVVDLKPIGGGLKRWLTRHKAGGISAARSLGIERHFRRRTHPLRPCRDLCYHKCMETVVRNVRDLPKNDRSALERVVGHQLRESQQLVIQVMSVSVEQPVPEPPASGELPAWCNVYQGLSDPEIDDLDSAIVRSDLSRDFS